MYKALYPYTAQHNDELTFDEGDILYISDQSENGWWKGTVHGKSGLVPSKLQRRSVNVYIIKEGHVLYCTYMVKYLNSPI